MNDTQDLAPARWAQVGDLVQTSKRQLMRVTSVKKVNYGVVDEDGRRWNLRKEWTYEAPVGAVFSGPEVDEVRKPTPREIPVPSGLVRQGSLVRIKAGKYADGKLLVVIRENKGSYSLSRLGGDPSGRYYRGFREADLEVIDPTRVRLDA